MYNPISSIVLLSLFILVGCSDELSEKVPLKSVASNWPIEIKERMEDQENAWNNGDIPLFMAGAYWPSDSMLFMGKNGVTWGYDATLQNYLTHYPNKTSMGTLDFENIHWIPLGDHHGLLVGKWHLQRSDSLNDVSGHYSLVWEYQEDRWVIIADHSS